MPTYKSTSSSWIGWWSRSQSRNVPESERPVLRLLLHWLRLISSLIVAPEPRPNLGGDSTNPLPSSHALSLARHMHMVTLTFLTANRPYTLVSKRGTHRDAHTTITSNSTVFSPKRSQRYHLIPIHIFIWYIHMTGLVDQMSTINGRMITWIATTGDHLCKGSFSRI